jgi:hypothetical protein
MDGTEVTRDVEWITRKGKINIKAITPKAREVMLADMQLGGEMFKDAGVFFMGVDPFNLDTTLARLRAKGLQTDDDEEAKLAALRKLTEF